MSDLTGVLGRLKPPDHAPPASAAIVGMGLRLPGEIVTPGELNHVLAKGLCVVKPTPEDRFDTSIWYSPDPSAPGKTWNTGGGYLDDVRGFDRAFFGTPPEEARFLDPQIRWLLEASVDATHDGGVALGRLQGHDRTAVVVGVTSHEYGLMCASPVDLSNVGEKANSGSNMCMPSNRISFDLNLQGPSFTVDTACSSSLYSTSLACGFLADGGSSYALSGGVNALLQPLTHVGFTKARMISPDGRCKSFATGADGYGRGEGAVVILLGRLALTDEHDDPVYALVRGSHLCNDGRTPGIAQPSLEAQEHLVRQACRKAGVGLRDLGCSEAHGTGTQIGDLTECTALGNTIGRARKEGGLGPLPVSSVKSNISHLEGAAGLAGIVKACLQLSRAVLFPTASLRSRSDLNPDIDWAQLHLAPTLVETLPWQRPTADGGATPLLCSVGSNGFGGANAFLILQSGDEERPPRPLDWAGGEAALLQRFQWCQGTPPVGERTEGVEKDLPLWPVEGHEEDVLMLDPAPPVGGRGDAAPAETHTATSCAAAGVPSLPPLVLSARSEKALRGNAVALLKLLHSVVGQPDAAERYCAMAHTLVMRQTLYEKRLVVSATSTVEAAMEELQKYLDTAGGSAAAQPATRGKAKGESPAAATAVMGSAPSPSQVTKIAAVFQGQGGHWAGMAKGLLEHSEAFRGVLRRIEDVLRRLQCPWSLREIFADPGQAARIITDTVVTQLAILTVQLGTWEELRAQGLFRAGQVAVMGHSIGEFAAACASGRLTLEQAVEACYHRGRCLSTLSGQGQMMAVGLPADEVERWLEPFGVSHLCIAARNGPTQTTVAGQPAAIKQLQSQLERQEIQATVLQGVQNAFHSPQCDAIRQEFESALADFRPQAAEDLLPQVSTATGEWLDAQSLGMGYWWRNIREPVLFDKAVRTLLDADYRLVVEVGPHPIHKGSIDVMAEGVGGKVHVIPTLRRGMPHRDMAWLCEATAWALALGAPVLLPNPAPFFPLPRYSWEHEACWAGSRRFEDTFLFPARARGHHLLGKSVGNHTWQAVWTKGLVPWLPHHDLQNQVVVPAAAFLEMFCRAGQERFAVSFSEAPGTGAEERGILIQGVRFEEFMHSAMSDGEREAEQTVRTEQVPDGQTRISSLAGGRWVLHSKAHVWHCTEAGAAAGLVTEGGWEGASEQRGWASLDPVKFYGEAMPKVGFKLGSAFRGIKGGWKKGLSYIFDVQASPEVLVEISHYTMHPALLDNVMQAFAWVQMRPQDALLTEGGFRIPHCVGEVQVYGSLPASFTIRFQVRKLATMAVADADFVDLQTGKLLVSFRGIKFAAGPSRGEASHRNSMLWTCNWYRDLELRPERDGTVAGGAKTIVLLGADAVTRACADHLARSKHTPWVPTPQEAEEVLALLRGDAAGIMAKPHDGGVSADMLNAVAMALGHGGDGIDVLLLSGFEGGDLPELQAELERRQEESTVLLLRCFQALAAGTAGAAARLWCITAGAVDPSDGRGLRRPDLAAPWGMALTFMHEDPELQVAMVDVDLSQGQERAFEAIRLELEASADPEAKVTPANEVCLRWTSEGTLERFLRKIGEVYPGHRLLGIPGHLQLLPQQSWEAHASDVGEISAYLSNKTIAPAPGLVCVEVHYVCQPRRAPAGDVLATSLSGVVAGTTSCGERVVAWQHCLPLASRVQVTDTWAGVPPEMELEVACSLVAALLPLASALPCCSSGPLRELRELLPSRLAVVLPGHRRPAPDEEARACAVLLLAKAIHGVGPDTCRLLRGGGSSLSTGQLSAAADPSGICVAPPAGLPSFDLVLFFGVEPDVSGMEQELCAPGGTVLLFLQNPSAVERELAGTLACYRSTRIVETSQAGLVAGPHTAQILRACLEAFQGSTEGQHWQKHVGVKPLHAAQTDSDVTTVFNCQPEALRLSMPLPAFWQPPLCRPGGCYLVTGGHGGLGRLLVEELAQKQGAERLVLFVRPGREVNLQALFSPETAQKVRVLPADLCNMDEVLRAVATARASWGPIQGVVHLAAKIDDAATDRVDSARLHDGLRAKAWGALALHHATRADRELHLFLLASSAVSVFGNAGQAVYSAANAVCDALAAHRVARGLPGTSVNLGVISEAGFAADHGLVEVWAARGLHAMAPREILPFFLRCALVGVANAGVTGMLDRQAFALGNLALFNAELRRPRFARLRELAPLADLRALRGGVSSLAARIRALPGGMEAQRAELRTAVCGEIARVLGMAADQLDRTRSLADQGLDSQTANRVSSALEAALGIGVPPMRLLRPDRSLEQLEEELLHGLLKQAAGEAEEAAGSSRAVAIRRANFPSAGRVGPEDAPAAAVPQGLEEVQKGCGADGPCLVLVPANGLGPANYLRFVHQFPPQLRVLCFQFRGWSGREAEEPLEDLNSMVRDMVEAFEKIQIEEAASWVVLGHSMGALLGYHFLLQLRSEGKVPAGPKHFFCCAWPAPDMEYAHPEHFRSPLMGGDGVPAEPTELLEALSKFNFLDASKLGSLEASALCSLAKCVRAGLRICAPRGWKRKRDDDQEGGAQKELACGITVFHGDSDAFIPDSAQMQAWGKFRSTQQPFACHMAPGDHFFLLGEAAGLVQRAVVDILALKGSEDPEDLLLVGS